jgi:hypothetical protein
MENIKKKKVRFADEVNEVKQVKLNSNTVEESFEIREYFYKGNSLDITTSKTSYLPSPPFEQTSSESVFESKYKFELYQLRSYLRKFTCLSEIENNAKYSSISINTPDLPDLYVAPPKIHITILEEDKITRISSKSSTASNSSSDTSMKFIYLDPNFRSNESFNQFGETFCEQPSNSECPKAIRSIPSSGEHNLKWCYPKCATKKTLRSCDLRSCPPPPPPSRLLSRSDDSTVGRRRRGLCSRIWRIFTRCCR